MRLAPELVLTDGERSELMRMVRGKRTCVRLNLRAGVILLAADGVHSSVIAETLSAGRVQVGRWCERFAEHRLAGMERDLFSRRASRPTAASVPNRMQHYTSGVAPADSVAGSRRAGPCQKFDGL